MKKIIYSLTISIFGGITALFIHNLNFNHNELNYNETYELIKKEFLSKNNSRSKT